MKTGQERELIRDIRPNLNLRPRWSPDGRWLLVNSRHDGGRFGLFCADARTGTLKPVVGDGVFWGIWSADSKSIIYVRDDGARGSVIRTRNRETRQEKELFRPDKPMHISNLALSWEGRQLAFGMHPISPIIGQTIAILPMSGGPPRELHQVARGSFHGLEWTPDGQSLLFASAGEMWRISPKGGSPEPIGIKLEGSDGFAVNRSQRLIAFIAGETKREVWLMENFLPRVERGK
jgi:Tol biopolymer transport system component